MGLASVKTSLIFVKSKYAFSVAQLRAFRNFSNARSCSFVHTNGLSFFVSSCRSQCGVVRDEAATKISHTKKLLTSVASFGVEHCSIASMLEGSREIP